MFRKLRNRSGFHCSPNKIQVIFINKIIITLVSITCYLVLVGVAWGLSCLIWYRILLYLEFGIHQLSLFPGITFNKWQSIIESEQTSWQVRCPCWCWVPGKTNHIWVVLATKTWWIMIKGPLCGKERKRVERWKKNIAKHINFVVIPFKPYVWPCFVLSLES